MKDVYNRRWGNLYRARLVRGDPPAPGERRLHLPDPADRPEGGESGAWAVVAQRQGERLVLRACATLAEAWRWLRRFRRGGLEAERLWVERWRGGVRPPARKRGRARR